jgi:F-type H+-transporting ATPase subunit b
VTLLHLFTTFAATEEHSSGGIAALGIDPWALLAQGVTFLILVWLLKKFAFGKIVDVLEQRRKAVEESIDHAEALKKQNEEAEKRVSALLHDARSQAEDIIGKSHEEAGAVLQEAQDKAVSQSEKIVAEGRAQIQTEVERARSELKKETLTLVAAATEALLHEKVDAKKNEALIKKALQEVK